MKLNNITISSIRSGKGECIHLNFNSCNLIIDTGTTSSSSEFRNLCKSIINKGEKLDALIITHYDEDHIGGILKTGDLGFVDVYFNAYDGRIENGDLSSSQMQRLFHLLSSTKVHSKVIVGDVLEIGGAKLTIHSPTVEALSKTKEQMKKSDEQLSFVSDWNCSFDELMDKSYPSKDSSFSNQASIVFTFEIEDNKILFTGDTWPEYIPSGKFDLVKLPHHGSIKNISDEIINKLDCSSFLICADGTKHPNKQTLAKLLKFKENVNIYSNYEWWMNGFMKTEDYKYLNNNKLNFYLI